MFPFFEGWLKHARHRDIARETRANKILITKKLLNKSLSLDARKVSAGARPAVGRAISIHCLGLGEDPHGGGGGVSHTGWMVDVRIQ